MSREITDAERRSVERLRRLFSEPQSAEEKAFVDAPTREGFDKLVCAARSKEILR